MIIDCSDMAKQSYGDDICDKNIFDISAISLFERSMEELKAGFADENYIMVKAP